MNDLELCLSIIERLDAHGRAAVARKLNTINEEILKTDRERLCAEECDKLCELVFNKTGLIIRGKSREYNTVCARRYVCKTLRDKGFTYCAIGKALKINHSSAIFHCKMAEDSEKYPMYYPEYHKVKKKIESED